MSVNRRDFLGLLGVGGLATVLATELRAGASRTALESYPAAAGTRWDPWLEINSANLAWNFRQIQARVGQKPVMAVIKVNAYGLGLVGVARALQNSGVDHFMVGKLDEARQLREAGIRGMILNYGPFNEADSEDIVRLGISQNSYTKQVEDLAAVARRLERPAHIHIKVDTGLGRVGVPHNQAPDFMERVAALQGVDIEGVFTTFTEDPEFDAVQLARFRQLCKGCAERGVPVGLRHAASSAAILDFPEAYTELDMVRPGSLFYGLYPSQRAEWEHKLPLKPTLSLKTRVVFVKSVSAGESVSYHRLFTATQTERIATLPAGHTDGLPSELEGKGNVLLAGRRCPIVAITSNAIMVRVGDAPVAPGDEAVLIGTQKGEEITISEVAKQSGRGVYRVAMEMSGQLPRVYV